MQSPASTNPEPAGKKKFPFGNLLKTLLALILIGLVFSKTNFSDVLALRDKISFPRLAWAFLLYVLLTFFKAFQYHILIGRKTAYLRVVSIVVWQNALTNFVAAGAGVASYLALFKEEDGVKFSRATLTFLITKVGDLFSIWLVFLISSILLWKKITSFHQIVLILGIGIGLGLLVFFALVLFRRRFAAILKSILNDIHLSKVAFIQKIVETIDAIASQEPQAIYKIIGRAFSLSALYYVITMAWMVASMRMFGVPMNIWVIIFVSGILQLLSIIPITVFGSLGLTEFTSLYLYGIFGMEQAVMSPVLLGWRAVFYLMNLVMLLYLPLHALVLGRSIKKD